MQEQLPKLDLSRRDAKLKCGSFLLNEISIWFGLLSEKIQFISNSVSGCLELLRPKV
jgi:hypothetical protein